MRKILLVFAVCVCSAVFAENIVLDLSNPGDFPIEYDETGLWADVFNNDAIVYSQEFMFSHASPYPAGVYVVRCGGYSTKIVK